MAAYTMAARMQLSAPEVADLASESSTTHTLYGTDHANPLLAAYGRNCMLARRWATAALFHQTFIKNLTILKCENFGIF